MNHGAPPVLTIVPSHSLDADNRADLRELIGWLDAQQQQHNAALAADIHDQLGSSLTALAMRLALIARQTNSDPKIAAQWDKANAQLAAIGDTARRVQRELRPVAIEALGLVASLVDYAHQIEQRSGMICTVEVRGDQQLPPADASQLFRIVQEALTNVERHAGASHVHLVFNRQAGACSIAIVDDGAGFDAAKQDWQRTHGVRLMRERASLLGMGFSLSSLPGHGCRVMVERTD